MKIKTLSLVFLFAMQTSLLVAMDNYPFSVGASVAGKVGISTGTTPEGILNAVSFLGGADLAAMVYLPMSNDSRTGVFVELGYTNTPFGLKLWKQQDFSYMNQKWLTVSPILLMSGVSVGLEFGFNAFDDWIDDNNMFGMLPIAKDGFNVTLRVGYMHPVWTTPVGTLNFQINGTYNITGTNYRGDFTYSPVTLSLGLNYLFNLESGDDY
ncbi:MAG: hypothetical protein FWG85_04650 [Bacteroidetes bacterium]|nr:hypothetical protein [Bacteroidota bacterium]